MNAAFPLLPGAERGFEARRAAGGLGLPPDREPGAGGKDRHVVTVTREREAGTWEAMRLSLLSPIQIMMGKLLAPLIACVAPR